jgi:hypothetical protein
MRHLIYLIFFFSLILPHFSYSDSIVNIIVPKISKEFLVCEYFFKKNCLACHGVHGSGIKNFGPPLVHKLYESSHHGDSSFVSAIRNGVRSHHWSFGDMAPVESISDDEILKVIGYIRFIQRANDIY